MHGVLNGSFSFGLAISGLDLKQLGVGRNHLSHSVAASVLIVKEARKMKTVLKIFERKRVRMLLFGRANSSHYNSMYFCYAKPKRLESTKFHCYFECYEYFHHSRNNAMPPTETEGFRSLGSVPFSEEPKRIHQ